MKLTLAKLAVAIVAVAGSVAGVSTGTAEAYSVTNSNCPGGIQVPRTNGYNGGAPSFEFPQRFAWRSPCYSSYTQVISVHYLLWGYVSGTGWVKQVSTTRTATVSPGFEGAWIMGQSGSARSADISAGVLVEWRLTNGALIGSQYVNYNALGDYRCATGGCGIYSDPTMGAFIHFVTAY